MNRLATLRPQPRDDSCFEAAHRSVLRVMRGGTLPLLQEAAARRGSQKLPLTSLLSRRTGWNSPSTSRRFTLA